MLAGLDWERVESLFTSVPWDDNACTTVATFNAFLNVQEGEVGAGEGSSESCEIGSRSDRR